MKVTWNTYEKLHRKEGKECPACGDSTWVYNTDNPNIVLCATCKAKITLYTKRAEYECATYERDCEMFRLGLRELKTREAGKLQHSRKIGIHP